jgi:hypothetical protein
VFIALSLQISFDLHPTPADAVRFVPVNLGFGKRTIRKEDRSKALQFSPSPITEAFFQMAKITDAVTDGDRLNLPDSTDQLEIPRHGVNLPQPMSLNACATS